jgi:hypothetical protein
VANRTSHSHTQSNNYIRIVPSSEADPAAQEMPE